MPSDAQRVSPLAQLRNRSDSLPNCGPKAAKQQYVDRNRRDKHAWSAQCGILNVLAKIYNSPDEVDKAKRGSNIHINQQAKCPKARQKRDQLLHGVVVHAEPSLEVGIAGNRRSFDFTFTPGRANKPAEHDKLNRREQRNNK